MMNTWTFPRGKKEEEVSHDFNPPSTIFQSKDDGIASFNYADQRLRKKILVL